MGKAIAVSVALVLIVGIIALVLYLLNRKQPEGDMTLKQERELRHLVEGAHRTFLSLGAAYAVEDTDVLSGRSQQSINEWLNSYETWNMKNRKEIDA